MLRIKRFRDEVMTEAFCIVSGKVPVYCHVPDLVDADEETENMLMGTGFFEGVPSDWLPDEGGTIITQEDIDVSQLIEDQTPKKKARIDHARNQAILKVIDEAGGIDKVDPKLAEALRARMDLDDPAVEEHVNDGDSEAAA